MTSPWCSVNDALIQNRCWLCDQTFPRGLKKKVFQVSHILDYFYIRREAEAQNENLPAFRSNNMMNCYARYKMLIPDDSPDDMINLEKEFKEIDMEVWMSGLICAQNEECRADMLLILPNATLDSRNDVSNAFDRAATTGKPSLFMVAASDSCPPGCNCDDPWRFLA